MSPAKNRRYAAIPGLSELGDHYMCDDHVASNECLSENSLVEFARNPQLPLFDNLHLSTCIRCASLSITFRSLSTIEAMPQTATVPLSIGHTFDLHAIRDSLTQVLGRICLNSMRFEPVDTDSAWEPHPLFMRVNIVLNTAIDMFAVTVLDVPEEIESVFVKTPSGRLQLTPGSPSGTHELFVPVSECGTDHQPIPAAEYLVQFLCDGKMELLFKAPFSKRQHFGTTTDSDVAVLLKSIGAFEQDYAYVLPTGLHADTHINAARICDSESAITQIANAIDQTFPEEFDVIATNGWPLATIARRVAAMRNQRNADTWVREIMFESYLDPMPVEDMPAGSRVIVLVDVSVTGGLVTRLSESVTRFGGIVIATGAIVVAVSRLASHPPKLRSLCRMKMALSKTDNTNDLRWRQKRYFNPLSSSMTEKKEQGRSPTEFYNSDVEIRAFWNLLEGLFRENVDIGRFYRRHKVVGSTHYSEFIDTLELLRYEPIGRRLLEQLRDKLAENQIVPEVLLCTDRLRARTFAQMLSESFDVNTSQRISIVQASKHRNGWCIQREEDCRKLRDRRVLVCDTAIGHGKTIDQLSLLANSFSPRSLGVAVILSRLSESCELAFSRRLSDGFHRLFNLPIRPVVIRGASRVICPVCQRQAAIESAAIETRSAAIESLAANYSRVPFKRPTEEVQKPQHTTDATQLTLFDTSPPQFLATCHAAIARGLTLHSLYAAKNNGMAPLALPEISDGSIPPKNRRAMVKDLPRGTLEWSGDPLEQSLEQCLVSDNTTGSIWSAAAYVQASERRMNWIENLPGLIERSPEIRLKPQPTFWNTVECASYLIARGSPADRDHLEFQLKSLADRFPGTEAAAGLRRILGTVTQLESSEVS